MEHESKLHFVGPLNLNRQTKQADTVMGAKLCLNAKEFDALDILATHEGEALTFEMIYTAIWDAGDGTCNANEAQKALDNLLSQVKETGKGFMWINHTELGYIFQSRWGHNWKEQKKVPNFFPLSNNVPFAKARKKRPIIALFTGASLVAASLLLTLVIFPRQNESEVDMVYIPDRPIPLAAPDFGESVVSLIDDSVTVLYDIEDDAQEGEVD